MITCKECKWWHEQGMAYSYTATHTVCTCPIDDGDTGCDVYAEALDDSGLEVALVTGKDFGCVNGEVIEPSDVSVAHYEAVSSAMEEEADEAEERLFRGELAHYSNQDLIDELKRREEYQEMIDAYDVEVEGL